MEKKLTWKPRLKDKIKFRPETETNNAAAQALDKMKKIEKRRNNGTLDQDYLEALAGKKAEKKNEKPWWLPF
jgi:hypothetical protein